MRVSGTVVDPQAADTGPEALVVTFEALLADADLPAFFRLLGVGRLDFSARRSLQPVFTALCAGLWRLALRRVVPDSAEEAYSRYMDSLWPKLKDADAYMVLVRDLARFLPESGADDFTPTAREIFSRAGREPGQAALVGMALFLRRLYEYFFNHII
ncbi:hypothetical protein [Mailhella massiliensis]|uniref:Uncharacterized protein n=1 Tax=Mailhella massiliensis TaxID=1903261 RepID=A0A921AYQ9_9BACT|nr:hypothetical protein [Mailhella massiliensis]HJD98248.1 hypothetical protein [Mailhella massiliensis]